MNMKFRTNRFIVEVAREVDSARKKFPTSEHQLAALTEEVGELAQALIDHDRAQKSSGGGSMCRTAHTRKVYAEAIQVAAMAVRVATEGDASMVYPMTRLLDGDEWELEDALKGRK